MQADIATHDTEIATNAANIAIHDTDIATNVANIASNTVAITNVDAQIEDLQLGGNCNFIFKQALPNICIGI